MAINKGTIKQKTNNGTEILYPITTVDQIQNLSTAVVDLTNNQVVDGQKDFEIIPRVKITHEVHNLPSEYQEVAYLESTGTQYIDTGVILTSLHAVEIDYQLTSTQQTNRRGLYGILSTNAASRFGSLFSPTNYQLEHGYGVSNVYWQQGLPDANRHILKQDKNITYMDGVVVRTFNEATFATTGNALLGNFNYTNYIPALAKYYESKWWNDDVLIRDFIPCYRIADDKPGYYDIVNNVFYINAGTSDFILGPNVEPFTYENLLTDAGIPSKTSQLTNDSGFITSSYHDSTKANQSSLNAVTAKIPTEASSSNQLADKAFVNSSIATATSTFRGTYTTLQDLQAASGDLNDYAFYNHTDAAGNTLYDRYKYTNNTPHWEFEYTLNNSSFTSDQWAALNSGVSSGTWVNTSTAQVIDGQKDFEVNPRVKVTHETHNLPDAYQEVEYIESNGTQYIDSGYIPNANSKVIFDSIIGVGAISSDIRQGRHGDGQRLSVAIVSGNKLEFAIGGYRAINLNVVGQRHLYELDVPNLVGKMDGITQATFSSTSWTNQQTLYFFARHMSNGQDGLGNVRNYNIKIYEQDVLIRHFIPCYRKSDDEPGMYDVINNIFYTNIGSGVFNIGSELYPVSYESLLTDASFATVATTGNYNDLTNKPTIPVVNNATLTIQKNGTSIGTFTANASSNVTANITVPTKTSDLTNDSGFIINPITTTGDIIIGGSNGSPTRLGIGTYGKILTSNGTSSVWQKPKMLYRHLLTILSNVHPTGYLSEMNMNIITTDDQLTYVNNPEQLLLDINNYICYYFSMVDGDVGICVPHVRQDENGNIGIAISYITYDWINNTTGATTEKIVFYFNNTETFATIEEIVVPYGKNHIGFNVPDGEFFKTFWCAEGQTWEDWIYSGNNIDNYSISENYILNSNGQQVIYDSYDGGQPVLKTDEIESGYYYEFNES